MTLPKEVEEDIVYASETEEVGIDVGEAYERGKVDINFFAALCLPSVSVYALPVFYIAVWQLLILRSPETLGRLLRFALGLPRSHAKTTFIKILICWLIVYDKASFILVVCANSDLADKIIADIHDILRSRNMTAVYGLWEEALMIDAADQKKAVYHNRPVTIVGRGWTAGIRGLNIQNERPDVIFCDDTQTKQNDESETDSKKLLAELTGTIFKAIAPRGNRLIIYVGNMYSENCILMKFKKHSKWISMITGAILADGTPLWPELFSLSDLKESYEHDEELGLAEIWFAEVMNDPVSTRRSLLPKPLPDVPEEYLDMPHDGAFITLDPAGFRKASDKNEIVLHEKKDNKFFVQTHLNEYNKPDEIIKETLRLAIIKGVSVIAVEAVAYQQTLAYWFSYFMLEWGITGIHVVELSPHGRTKQSRIRNFIAECYGGHYYIEDVKTRRDFVWQASMYKMDKTENVDDLLDAVAYGVDVRNEYGYLIVPVNKAVIDSKDYELVTGNTPF